MTNAPSTTCLIAGGGPAGMMCGYLLARAGIDVTVLEKHADFFRDFRGDTIHPSTLQVMDELGLLEDFLKLPHQEVRHAEGELGDTRIRVADFTHLPTRCKFIAFLPQWDFLNFLAGKARAFPNFRLLMETEAAGLIRERDRVCGLMAKSPEGEFAIRALLTIAADGRHSALRDAAGSRVRNLGAPMDVLWFKLALRQGDRPAVLGRIAGGAVLVRLYRGDYWQCGLIIRKGSFEEVQRQGLEAFRARVATLAHRDSAEEIAGWDEVRLLTVAVDRLECWWQPGLLFIGDAAHAMSPIGGVGINLAIQDAVAAANIIAAPLRRGVLTHRDLARVEKRRRFPTWATQKMQTTAQNRVIDPLLSSGRTPAVPGLVKLAQRWTWLQRIPARLIGMGFRPEHVSRDLL
jgi:2-polyprenyl-6-methoxyphenol hydroxylase-like FAD-dependent oxidoreductase